MSRVLDMGRHLQTMKGNIVDKLTEKQVKQYILNGGERCPVCGSEEIVAELSCDVDNIRLYREVKCLICDTHWTDGYTLTNVGTGKYQDFEFIYPEVSQTESKDDLLRDICIGYLGCHGRRTRATRQALQDRIAAIYIARAIKGFLKGGQKTVADLARFLESIAEAESS